MMSDGKTSMQRMNIEKRILDLHHYTITPPKNEKDRWQTYVKPEGRKRKVIRDSSYDGLMDKLFNFYFNGVSFDSLTLECCENEEFGDENVFARHFTEFSMKHSKLKAEMADEEKIKLLNPIPFIENGNCDVAKNWRIRHGAFDRDTSLAIPVILATLLQNKGYQVDFCLPWGLPHSGDYDLKELFEWIDCLAKNQKSEK